VATIYPMDKVDEVLAAIVHYFGSTSVRKLNKVFAYLALKIPELADYVVVGHHGYIVERYKERLKRLEAMGLLCIVEKGGRVREVERRGSFEVPEELSSLLAEAAEILERRGIVGLMRLVEQKTGLAGLKYEYVGRKMSEVVAEWRKMLEEVEENRRKCPRCPTVRDFLEARRSLEGISEQ